MRVGIVAGEASADALGAGFMAALKARVPNAQFEGVGGPQMIAQGCRSLYPAEKLAVMGLVEVIGRLPELLRIRAALLKHFLHDPPDVFMGIDAPDFNLGLERKLKSAGIPTVHYVSPSVWAWRQNRVAGIALSVDLMLTLFPFEAAFYRKQRQHHVAVRFVGHPLADRIPLADPAAQDGLRTAARADLGLPLAGPVVALMPGSRRGELRFMAARFAQTAAYCAHRLPQLHFVAPQASDATRALFEAAFARHAPATLVTVLNGDSQRALCAADAVLMASGTATLEALLLDRPMIVVYRVARLTAWIARRLVKIPYFALPNLLAGRALVSEFIQDEFIPAVVGEALLQLLGEPDGALALRSTFAAIHATLQQGASQNAADAVLQLLDNRRRC